MVLRRKGLHDGARPRADGSSSASTSDHWYPGKHFQAALQRIEQRKNQIRTARQRGEAIQLPRRPLITLRNIVFKGKRPLRARTGNGIGSLGELSLTVLGGSFRTTRAFVVVELDGNERRTSVATCDTPSWHDADFEFPVFDPSSDVRLLLYSDEAANNNRPIGRCILPLTYLCSQGTMLPRPSAARRLVVRFMPISTQHSDRLLARYSEATPRVPGSGMVRPETEIGSLEIVVLLRLEPPGSGPLGLLAAYAMCSPPGAIEDAGGEGSDESEAVATGAVSDEPPVAMDPKVLRLSLIRIRRCLGAPYLLEPPWCLALPLVLWAACFRVPLALQPWLVLGLALANGAIDGHRSEWKTEAIFWEEHVGEGDMPRGPLGKLKLLREMLSRLQRALVTLAELLERRRNLLNWSDPAVTAVAIGVLSVSCAIVSCTIAVVPLNWLFFVAGMSCLLPALSRACARLLPARAHRAYANAASTHEARAHETVVDPSQEQDQVPAGTRTTSGEQERTMMEQEPSRDGGLTVLRMLRNVLARVPDSTDLAHRHFCAVEQIIEEELVVEREAGGGLERKPQ